MINLMSVNNIIITAGLFQTEVSDNPAYQGYTICDMESVFCQIYVCSAEVSTLLDPCFVCFSLLFLVIVIQYFNNLFYTNLYE